MTSAVRQPEERLSLAQLLPQAEPMILLTDYEPPADDGAVTAFVDVSPASPFFDASVGGVPGCVSLEYMAQTMALCTGFHNRSRGIAPKIGFVLGSRRLEIGIPFFQAGARYRVRVSCLYTDESFGSFDCEIFAPSGESVARAQMTAFQPGDDLTPETLKEYR